MKTPVRFLVLPACALVFGTACFREVNNARASYYAQRHSLDQLQAAVRCTPGDAVRWRQLAIVLLHQKSESAVEALKRAAELSAFETDARLGLAVEQERKGQIAEAERYYTEAAKLSRRFKSQSALAGFYFRTRQFPQFWKAASGAVNIEMADVTPVIRLAHQTSVEPEEVLRRLQIRSTHAEAAYIKYALDNRMDKQAAAVAGVASITEQSKPLLLASCDRLIAAGNIAKAVAVWNRLAKANAFSLEELDPVRGRSLTNGSFQIVPVSGFNSMFSDLPGVFVRAAARSGASIEFSGEQPHEGVLFHQPAPVLPGNKYQLRLRYETLDLEGPTGLTLVVQSARRGETIAAAPVSAAAGEGTATTEFKAPDNCDLLRLVLRYKRVPGTVRIQGILTLLSADLELQS